MTKQLVAFDMDGTLTEASNSFKELYRAFDYDDSRTRAMWLNGTLNAWEATTLDLCNLIQGRDITRKAVEGIMKAIPRREGIGEVVDYLKGRGYHVVIVSAGIKTLAEQLKKEYKFDAVYANEIGFSGHSLTGRYNEIVDVLDKGKTINKLRNDKGWEDIVSVGDSVYDVPMFDASEFPIQLITNDTENILANTMIHDLRDLMKVL